MSVLSTSLAAEFAYWQTSGFKLLMAIVAVLIPAGGTVYLYLFKMVSFMQSRLGPMEAGPYGSLQLVAELGKNIQKEDIVPHKADRFVFKAAPFVVLISTFLLVLVVPFGPDAVFVNFDTGIFFALAVSSVSVIGILMAGWASASKYSLLGGLRAAGQLIAYELPLVLAVVGVIIQAGTLNMQGIVNAQINNEIFGWGAIGNPFILTQFVGFFIFMVAVQAELTQVPFDMPIAESELVSGYMTEYSGFRFLMFFIGEFATANIFAFLASVLFLGGWSLPPFIMDLLPGASDGEISNWMNVIGPLVMGGKMLLLTFIIYWVRFTYPRFREDQLQTFAWKFLIPLSLVNIAITGLLKVVF
jgi:NADH-quinone oxidoreductase subunit H